ncbi:MAG: helix-turn-helix domain-containing protein [Chloroflexota bacterium]
MPHDAKKAHYIILKQVTTVAEASRACGCARNTIQYAIDAGNIAALKCGGVWLISVSSLRTWNKNRLRKTA